MIKFNVILVVIVLSISSTARAEVLYSYSGWLVGEKYYVYEGDDGDLLLNFGGDSIGDVSQCE